MNQFRKRAGAALRSITPTSWTLIIALVLIIVLCVAIVRLQHMVVDGDQAVLNIIAERRGIRDAERDINEGRLQSLEADVARIEGRLRRSDGAQ